MYIVMRAFTELPIALVKLALRIINGVVPIYASVYSRHDFTQYQPFAILILRQFQITDYRMAFDYCNPR
jgi:hypothetical protein